MFGERIRPSLYNIKFMENQTCQMACKKTYKGGDSESDRKLMILKKGMSLNYQHHWTIDNLPGTWCYTQSNDSQHCSTGFPMGCLVRHSKHPEDEQSCPINIKYNKRGTYYPFNHVDLTITYKSGESEDLKQIISVNVKPSSIQHNPNQLDCSGQTPMEIPSVPLDNGKTLEIIYSYSVKFVEKFPPKMKTGWVFRFWPYRI